MESQLVADALVAVSQALPYAILLLDDEMQILAANEAFCEVSGVRAVSVQGRHFFEIEGGQWATHNLRKRLAELRPSDTPITFDVDFPDAPLRPVLCRACAIDEGDRYVLITVEDSTGQLLLRSREQLRLFIKHAEEYAFFGMDADGRILEWNEGAERVLGWREDEVVGRTGGLIFTPEDRQKGLFEAKMGEAVVHGSTQAECWHVRKDGSRFWGVGTLVALRNAAGDVYGFSTILRDNTRRKEAYEALRESEVRRLLAVEAAGVGDWVFDVAAQKMQWSGRTRAMHRVDDEARDDFELSIQLLHPDDRDRVLEAMAAAADPAGEGSYHVQFRFLFDDGDVRWIDSRGRTLFEETPTGRQPTYIVGAMVDITDRVHAEEKLKELNESLEERVERRTRQVRRLASRLTMAEQVERRRIAQVLHDDLQQLLYGIQVRVSLIYRDALAAGQHELVASAEKIDTWVSEAIELTRGLAVDLSPPVLQDESLGTILRWLGHRMELQFGLTIEVQERTEAVVRRHDMRILLFQIVRELLFNVVKHAEVGQAVVTLDEQAAYLVIEVADEGKGSNPSGRREPGREGQGFGIASIQERLALFGGVLAFSSTPGEGTRARIHVPLESLR